jgi:hypothetical protein
MTRADHLVERMRRKQGLAPQGKPPVPTGETIQIKHPCGHDSTFLEYKTEQPDFREKRLEKEKGRACPPCRREKQKREEEKAAAKRKEKAARQKPPVDPGVGVGYTFVLHHLDVSVWNYELVRTSDEELNPLLKGTAPSLRKAVGAMTEALIAIG